MSTNRPFLSNFLAAFRAHSAIQKAATSPPSSTAHNVYGSTSAASTNPSTSSTTTTTRTITTTAKPGNQGATSAAVQAAGAQFQPTRQHAAPYHRSTSPKAGAGFPIPGAGARERRGSDSSNEGFREVMGSEKWYIGGRTAGGEEKFYKLGMVRKQRSIDRLSLDRLSI
ncbi:uncharacterized protein BDZ99DRAFT_462126 [Mytilinidion resinicola]|uniref:Uncharacterized protein n=1 Tax=Mytilinidion resinicola TaxID=574789 RepID=A0A6A6YPV2_9PEZI|nr:uncharacterized protein BDZ99DRAFT_462126 [Mytilinidion resinicola]KAF2810810.1 hypothetical protein BDZ99DRAFT_462126 [Mytilinidion resinicola]